MHRRHRHSLSHFLELTALLFAIWVLLSGKFELRFLVIGLISSIVVSFVSLPFLMIKNSKTGREFFVLGMNYIKFVPYILWLLKEIFRSGLDVAGEILKRRVDYEPRIVYFSMPFENPMADIVLANSIILTPGTITIDVTDDGIFEVHALNKTAAEDMLSGAMPMRVAALFGETCKFTPMPEAEILNIPKEAE